jgi:hypothetical protein
MLESVKKSVATNWSKEYNRMETTAFDKGSCGLSNGCRRDETEINFLLILDSCGIIVRKWPRDRQVKSVCRLPLSHGAWLRTYIPWPVLVEGNERYMLAQRSMLQCHNSPLFGRTPIVIG